MIGHILGGVPMLKQQGKCRQLNIEAVDLKNLTGGVDMCFELMTGPLPFFPWATAALCSGTAGDSQPKRPFPKEKSIYWSSMQASRISLQHTGLQK